MGRYLLDTHIAISEQMTLISADRNIAQYDVPLIW
jgi:PIN domain nuclease of toxin-antitoxin system